MTEWSFGAPLFLWGLLLLIPLGMILRFWILSRQKAVFSLGLSFSKIRVVFQMLMIWLGFAFLLLALAQPRYGYEEITVQQEGRDIVVVLDASVPMMHAINISLIDDACMYHVGSVCGTLGCLLVREPR